MLSSPVLKLLLSIIGQSRCRLYAVPKSKGCRTLREAGVMFGCRWMVFETTTQEYRIKNDASGVLIVVSIPTGHTASEFPGRQQQHSGEYVF